MEAAVVAPVPDLRDPLGKLLRPGSPDCVGLGAAGGRGAVSGPFQMTCISVGRMHWI